MSDNQPKDPTVDETQTNNDETQTVVKEAAPAADVTDKTPESSAKGKAPLALGPDETVESLTEKFNFLNGELEKWKGYSRLHEGNYEKLQHEVSVNTVMNEYGLDDKAKILFKNAKDEKAIREIADALSEIVAPNVAPKEVTAEQGISALFSVNPLQATTKEKQMTPDEIIQQGFLDLLKK